MSAQVSPAMTSFEFLLNLGYLMKLLFFIMLLKFNSQLSIIIYLVLSLGAFLMTLDISLFINLIMSTNIGEF